MDNFDIENSVGFLLAKAYQRLFAHFREQLAPFGITPPQFALLAFLWQQDGLSQTELSSKTEVDRTTLSGLIDRLARLDLVERRPHPEDRRSYRICLTRKGQALERVLPPLALETRKRFTANLTAAECEQLCELLARLRQ